MKFHTQRFLHNPPHTYGDCQRTVFACILDMEPEQIPNFGEHYEDEESWNMAQDAWLKKMGLSMIRIWYQPPLENLLATMKASNPGHYYLLSGVSARGTRHVVIALDDKIIHDTAIGSTNPADGIVAPYDTEGLYCVEFIVPAFHKAQAARA